MKCKLLVGLSICILVVVAITFGGSIYMLQYALAPNSDRADTSQCYATLFERYPETRPWVDSLRRHGALRDTFVAMPGGERHHAIYVDNHSTHTALLMHGWRNCSINMLVIGRLYEQELGYSIVLPDFHAHGLSDGEMIRMGWLDRHDMAHWLSIFATDTMVVHGVSMGGATTMMMSTLPLPDGVRSIKYVEDCGYSSVWDEFEYELKEEFGLPAFPLLYTTSVLCKLWYGWDFNEASAVHEVARCSRPMLFIHGDQDTFVPTAMVHDVYNAKPMPRELWIVPGAIHARAYMTNKQEYLNRIKAFLEDECVK